MRGRTHRAPALAVPQQHGSSRTLNAVSVCRSDIFPMRCRGAKSFVDDLDWVGVSYLVEQPPHCDLLRLSLVTWRFVRNGRTYFRKGLWDATFVSCIQKSCSPFLKTLFLSFSSLRRCRRPFGLVLSRSVGLSCCGRIRPDSVAFARQREGLTYD